MQKLYSNRFNLKHRKKKLLLWDILVKDLLQKYIDIESDILDIGGGYCEFINQIQAKRKYLIDLNPDAQKLANPDVNVLNINILSFKEQQLINKTFDNIFISNFFEHLESKEELVEVLAFCFHSLNPGGSLFMIQPNFKYS